MHFLIFFFLWTLSTATYYFRELCFGDSEEILQINHAVGSVWSSSVQCEKQKTLFLLILVITACAW